ncbi:ATP-binding cassette domain-containing protein [Nocardia sp. NPDC004068]|uniref:ATP-binding cassette domain-containing protein n=1 Tax=Nocardia sp. NPDC004068 TaxID=3364303 RepID=UPI00367FCB4E
MSAPRSLAFAITGLHKRFDGVPALRDVSFTVPAGTTTALVGPPGSGKTTLVRVLAGLLAPDSGTAAVGGPGSKARPGKRSVGVVLQPRGLHPGRTVRGESRVWAAAAGVSDERAAAVLAFTGLEPVADLRVGALSPGLASRLALAVALLDDPPLLLLDDPLAGLDGAERDWLFELLRGHTRRGGTTLFTAQSLAAALPVADQLVVLGAGTVVFEGSPRRLRRGHPDRLIVGASSPIALATVLAARGFTDAVMRADGRLAVAEASRTEIEDAARAAKVHLTDLVPEPVHPDRVLATLTDSAAPVPQIPYGGSR